MKTLCAPKPELPMVRSVKKFNTPSSDPNQTYEYINA